MKSSSRSQIARRAVSSIAHTVIASGTVRSDLVVVGAGAAGLFAALTAARDGDLALGLEGGHSRRRIIHAGGSATGRRILRALSAAAAAHPRITILEGERVSGLLEGGGVV